MIGLPVSESTDETALPDSAASGRFLKENETRQIG
jgi:hypothetical protein